jgi:hypothetical protein
MRTRHLRGAKPSVHLVHEDRTTANNAVIMGDSPRSFAFGSGYVSGAFAPETSYLLLLKEKRSPREACTHDGHHNVVTLLVAVPIL